MYHWVEDKDFKKVAYRICADMVNRLVQNLKKYDVEASMYVVGSQRRNMVTQNANKPIDFDFNLFIEDDDDLNERDLKETVRKAFNEVLREKGWGDCQDSTSVLSTESRVLTKGNQTPFSIDVCIVCCGRFNRIYRLIHEKTGIVNNDRYYWNMEPKTQKLWKKEEYLKPDYWQEVREAYLEKKNMYLRRNDKNHPSFVCYIEAVNEVYDRVRGINDM